MRLILYTAAVCLILCVSSCRSAVDKMGDLKAKGFNERAIKVGIERIEELIEAEGREDLDERALVQAQVAQLMFLKVRRDHTVEGYKRLRAQIRRWPLTKPLQKEILNLESRLVWEGDQAQHYQYSFIKSFLATYPDTYYESQANRYLQRIKFYRDTIADASLGAYKDYLIDPKADLKYIGEVRELLCDSYLKQESSRDVEPFSSADVRAEFRRICTESKWSTREKRLKFDYDLRRVDPRDQSSMDRLIDKYRHFSDKSIVQDLVKLKNDYYTKLFEETVSSQDPHQLLRFASQSATPQSLATKAREIAYSLDTQRVKDSNSVIIISSYLSFWADRITPDMIANLTLRLETLLKNQNKFDAYEVRALLSLVNKYPQLSSRQESYRSIIESHLTESLNALSVSELSDYYVSLREEPKSELTALYLKVAQDVLFNRHDRYKELKTWVTDQNQLYRLLSELMPISKFVNLGKSDEKQRVVVESLRRADRVFEKLEGYQVSLQGVTLNSRLDETKLTAFGKRREKQNERRIKKLLAKKGLRISDLEGKKALFALFLAPEIMLAHQNTDCDRCRRKTGKSSLDFKLKVQENSPYEGIVDTLIEVPCRDLGLSCGAKNLGTLKEFYGLSELTFTPVTVIVDGVDFRKQEEIFEEDRLKVSGKIKSVYLTDHGLVIELSYRGFRMSLVKQ
jgi:hypothetical protein